MEIFTVPIVAMAVSFSSVILPKMSTLSCMKFLTNLLTPFLMAMTFPCYTTLAASPLKNALTVAV